MRANGEGDVMRVGESVLVVLPTALVSRDTFRQTRVTMQYVHKKGIERHRSLLRKN